MKSSRVTRVCIASLLAIGSVYCGHADSSGTDNSAAATDSSAPRYSGTASTSEVIRKPVVRIFARRAGRPDIPVGSGVVIGKSAADSGGSYLYIVTAYHVVQAIADLRASPVVGANGSKKSSDAVATRPRQLFPDMDIAFLETNELKAEPAQVVVTRPKQDEHVQSVGYPGAADRAIAEPENNVFVRPGEISNVETRSLKIVRGPTPPVSIIMHSAPISPGDSGGGLYDACGGLVGINHSDSGHYEARAPGGVDIPAQTGVYVAIFAGEIARVAKLSGISVSTVSGPCVAGTAPAPAPSVAEQPAIQTPVSTAPPPTNSLDGRSILYFALGVALLAVALGAAAVVFMRRAKKLDTTKKLLPPEAKRAVAPAQSKSLSLQGVDGGGNRVEFNITSAEASRGGGIVIGRAPSDGGLLLSDDRRQPLVSREHARVSFRDGYFTIEDTSMNHTFIGLEQLQKGVPRQLRGGEDIKFADRAFTVQIN